MGRGLIVVEGHGENGAAPNLVNRLWADLSLPFAVWGPRPTRWKKLTSEAGIAQLCDIVRSRVEYDRMLVLRDDEDDCPKTSGPLVADLFRAAALPFPVAVTLLYREYETLFLPSLPAMAGKPIVDPNGNTRPGLVAGAVYDGDPEAKRDAKGVISSFMPAGRTYKPTTDQLALTRMIDFGLVRGAGLACFGTLERALRFLGVAAGGEVYPPSPTA